MKKEEANQLFIQAHHAQQNGDLITAEKLFQAGLKLDPENFNALNLLGIVAIQIHHFPLAIRSIEAAILLNRSNALSFANLGFAQHAIKMHEQAEMSYQNALNISPQLTDVLFNQGNLYCDTGEFNKAILSYQKAIAIQPNHLLLNNLGTAFKELKEWDKALASYQQSISLNPTFAIAYNNIGSILLELRDYNRAETYFSKALALNPNYVEAHVGRGNAFFNRKQYQDAISDYGKAIDINPNFPFIRGSLFHAKSLCCDWGQFDTSFKLIVDKVQNGEQVIEPFAFIGASQSESDSHLCSKTFIESQIKANQRPFAYPPPSAKKIKVGYLCGEFRHQATSILMAELYELHDKTSFEIYAFDNGWDDASDIRQRLNVAFHQIIDISHINDFQAAKLINDLEIDILVNLNGFFGRPRNGIFALKPCPIQVSYLGWPGTMGTKFMDYLIADEITIPLSSRRYYSEEILYLPNSYQVNDRQRKASNKRFIRSEFGLPEQGFVFCCFNNSYKLNPMIFDSWMKILLKVDGSVLWLLEEDGQMDSNLRREAEARGVDGSRLIFAKRLDFPEHLARHSLADLFLDTLPYNAHTTASDALWVGLPVLTCLGNTFPGRVAASLLNALDVPELITQTLTEYELLAIELACNPNKLASIKTKLLHNRSIAPLFDTPLFTKAIEKAYCKIFQQFHFPKQ